GGPRRSAPAARRRAPPGRTPAQRAGRGRRRGGGGGCATWIRGYGILEGNRPRGFTERPGQAALADDGHLADGGLPPGGEAAEVDAGGQPRAVGGEGDRVAAGVERGVEEHGHLAA